jgi:hypothetical protein
MGGRVCRCWLGKGSPFKQGNRRLCRSGLGGYLVGIGEERSVKRDHAMWGVGIQWFCSRN